MGWGNEDDSVAIASLGGGRRLGRARWRAGGAAIAVVALVVATVALASDDGGGPQRRVASDGGATTSTIADTEAIALDVGVADEPTDEGATPTTALRSTTVKPRAGAATSTTVQPTSTTSVEGPSPMPRPAPQSFGESCGSPVTQWYSHDETMSSVVGVWVSCGGSVFGTDEDGLEIGANGRWAKLRRSDDDVLVRQTGWANAGYWNTTGDWGTLSLMPDGGMRHQALPSPAFSDDRSAMKLNQMGVLEGNYRRASAGVSIAPAVPKTGDECVKEEGADRQFQSEAEIRLAVAHVWVLCQGPSWMGTSAAGIEFRPDGTWSELSRRGDGVLVRVTDGRYSGTWETNDGTMMNGPGFYGLSVSSAEGTRGAFPSFATASSKARFGYYYDDAPSYVIAPAGTVVVDG